MKNHTALKTIDEELGLDWKTQWRKVWYWVSVCGAFWLGVYLESHK